MLREEKEARGIRYTPPKSSGSQLRGGRRSKLPDQQAILRQFVLESGFDLRKASGNLTVFLIGAGTSDYVAVL